MLSGFSIQNSILKCDLIEAEYMAIIAKYNKEEALLFSNLLAELALGLASEIGDFLGEVFMTMELGSARLGQFFTPYHLAKLMAQVTIGDKVSILSNKPFFTVSEPTCGAGGMIIAVADYLLESNFNPTETMWCEARDLDPVAAMMCYVQLSLLSIPARVVTGNTLTLEENRVFYTPSHYFGHWDHKLRKYWDNESIKKVEEIKKVTSPDIEESFINPENVSIESFVPFEVERGETFTLF